MSIRVDNDIRLTPTNDPAIFIVDAKVTKDLAEVTDPTIVSVRAKWNKNTGNTGLLNVLEKAMPQGDTSLEDAIKATVCETLVPTKEVTSEPAPDYTINATNVTVNQAVK